MRRFRDDLQFQIVLVLSARRGSDRATWYRLSLPGRPNGQRGWVPSITPRGIERTDILAQHSATGQVVALQVKTANLGNAFRLGPKNEEPARQWNEWYVFVALAEVGKRPRFFIVPTNVVAGLLYVGHRVWLAGTKRDGTPRKDSATRRSPT